MRKKYFLGALSGLTLGLLLSVGMAVYATWQDPTSAPPTGGSFKVNTTGPPTNGNCTLAAGGTLWYDDAAGDLFLCDGQNPGAWEKLSG